MAQLWPKSWGERSSDVKLWEQWSCFVTFPDDLIPLAKEAYTITQAKNRQPARGQRMSPGYSIPLEMCNTLYLQGDV